VCINHASAAPASVRTTQRPYWRRSGIGVFSLYVRKQLLARFTNWLEGLYILVVGKMQNAESCRVSGLASYALPSYDINENITPKNPSIL